jgi:hypothetical protein
VVVVVVEVQLVVLDMVMVMVMVLVVLVTRVMDGFIGTNGESVAALAFVSKREVAQQ